MTIDPAAVQSLIAAIGAVVAAAVALWNAFQTSKLKKEMASELKALRYAAAEQQKLPRRKTR